ncbi:MAG: peptide chain release factor aRF-1 [Nanoarchaeota archaeon]
MDTKKRQKLRKFLKELESIRGRHTELVSVYIPADYELIKIIQHLQQEQGTAENIKDKTTRLHVIDSLEKAIRHLRLYKKTPEHGLAVFAGNASEKDNQVDLKVWSIEPPLPIQTRLYRCDQVFVLDILREQLEAKDVYGLIVLDNREGNIGLLRGTLITEIASLTSGVPGKIKAGGQSQQRFARLREGAAHEFYKRIGEIANKEFYNRKELKGIIIGGPGPTKEIFLDGNYLNNEVKKKVIGTKDLSYTGEYGLHELVEKSRDLLAEETITKEKQLLEKFFTILSKEPKKITYGKEKTKKALEYGAVDTLLLSEDLNEQDLTELENLADQTSTHIEIISIDTKEGQQFKQLSGIGAILRYAL